ncbi:MAG TPA: DUF3267 domain-containing protein [Longimicrobium sp.]|jgi:hypothetical protein
MANEEIQRDRTGPASADRTVSFRTANLVALVATVAMAGVAVALWTAIWGFEPGLRDLAGQTLGLALFGPALLVGIVVHEAIHAVCFHLIGRVPREQISFGIHGRTLTPYVGTSAAMSARAYRASAAMPGIVLGAVPFAWGMAVGSPVVTLFGWVMLVSAAGDATVIWMLRGLPASTRVVDAPDRVGCVLA